MSDNATVVVYSDTNEFAFNLRSYTLTTEVKVLKSGLFKNGHAWYELRLSKIGHSGKPEDGEGWSLSEDEFMHFGQSVTWRVLRGKSEAEYWKSRVGARSDTPESEAFGIGAIR